MTASPFTVAIDGPAASGKGTIGRAVAARFGFEYLDTGLLYRAVGRAVLEGTPAEEAALALRAEDLKRDGLRTSEVGAAASKVAAIPEVRAALLDFQRAFARRSGGAVLDGRDIGTVICPEAEAKLFVTASVRVRALRRWQELHDAGETVTAEEVLDSLKARDQRDAGRPDAPLAAAGDALVLDTTEMSIEEAVEAAAAHISKALGR